MQRRQHGFLWLTGLVLPALVLATALPDAAVVTAAQANSYIVVLRDDVDSRGAAREHGSAHGFQAAHVYEHALKGYAARLSSQAVAAIAADPRVRFVSPDQPVEAFKRRPQPTQTPALPP